MAVVKSAPAPQQAQIYFIQADHLNAPRVILNNANIPIWRWDAADAFGTTLPNEDPDGDGNIFEYNLRFPGQYYDKETGLHYNYFRDYDPGIGRYIQSDPIGLKGGLNTYTYVSNNPTNLIDPFGLEEGSPTNLIKRQLINDLALNYNGSTAWCFNCKKDNFPAGSNKCNKYVYDVTNQAGAKPSVNGRAPLAAEWATPSVTIPNWRALNNNETPQAGDVAAYTLSGGGSAYSGHTGIMTSDFFGLWDSNSSAHHDIVSPVLGQFENKRSTVYRRFTGD